MDEIGFFVEFKNENKRGFFEDILTLKRLFRRQILKKSQLNHNPTTLKTE